MPKGMTTSQTRRNCRRRTASAAVAVGASAALLAGTTLTAPPAQADLFPLSIGSIGDVLPVGVASCDAGDPEIDTDLLNTATADCTQSSPWLLTALADAVLGIVAPDIAGLVSIGGLNGALATPGPEGNVSLFPPNLSVYIPGSAAVSGTGYTTAVTVLGGQSSARADYILAAAVAVAATGGIATADALFGVSVATAVGRPATQASLLPAWDIGSPRVENSATARSLPFGIAIANSSLTVDEVVGGLFANAPQHRASTVALGGITSAYRAVDGSQGAVCTALYGEARVHKQTLDDDGDVVSSQRTNSCTSVLFIFQKQQNVGEHGAFEVYAIKNPFDIGLVSPFGDDIAAFISDVTEGIINLGPLNDVLAGKFVPEFQSDVIRIVMDPAGPRIETDLPTWLESLFGSAQTNSLLPLAAVATDDTAPTVLSLAGNAGEAEEPQAGVTSKSTTESVADAGIVVNDPEPLPLVQTPELADPPAIEIVDSVPHESPQPEAPAEQTPAEQTPADETPADETSAAAPETAPDAELEVSLG